MIKKEYLPPQSEQFRTEWEKNFCLSGDIPSNSIGDFTIVGSGDIDWDTE